jgi:hypothetical protein
MKPWREDDDRGSTADLRRAADRSVTLEAIDQAGIDHLA